MNRFAELLQILEKDVSTRSIGLTGQRRETIIDALRIASTYVPLPAISHATDNEKRIVGKLVTDFLEQGIGITVNDGEETVLLNSTDPDAIYAALGSTGQDNIYVMISGKRKWISLVWGNDVDVISYYHVSLEPYLAGANALANEIDK